MKNNILEIKNCILNDLDQLPEEGVIYEDLLNDIVIERYRDMFLEERFEYNIYISDTLVDCYVKILKDTEVTDPNVLINDVNLIVLYQWNHLIIMIININILQLCMIILKKLMNGWKRIRINIVNLTL